MEQDTRMMEVKAGERKKRVRDVAPRCAVCTLSHDAYAETRRASRALPPTIIYDRLA